MSVKVVCNTVAHYLLAVSQALTGLFSHAHTTRAVGPGLVRVAVAGTTISCAGHTKVTHQRAGHRRSVKG
eukprot:SAG31_NODE_1043_length_10184_cov_2.174517_4_plen_70_part_00